MKVQSIECFDVVGFSVRTKNEDEMKTGMAKIGGLWSQFFLNAGPKLLPESKIYGVYTHYESDFTGCFDVIAGSDTLTTDTLEGLTKVTIPSGNYLCFSAQGIMPQTVIALWGEVWSYFTAGDCPHTRLYTADFELYKNTTDVEIYIAVE
jgi:predicted transcriptional regulator YdeE